MSYALRLLSKADEAALDAFLKPHTPFVYFSRSNARKGGIVYRGQPYQSAFIGAFEETRLTGVVAHDWMDGVRVFAADEACIADLAAAWRAYRTQTGRQAVTVAGPAAQVDHFVKSAALPETVYRGGHEGERLFALSLQELKLPKMLGRKEVGVRRALVGDLPWLARAAHDFYVEVYGEPGGAMTLRLATQDVERRVADRALYVLEIGGQLMALCGVSGFLPDWRCLGPVWVPPENRARGYGSAIVAGSLFMLRHAGAENALLTTHNPIAMRAYRSLGFREVGAWKFGYCRLAAEA